MMTAFSWLFMMRRSGLSCPALTRVSVCVCRFWATPTRRCSSVSNTRWPRSESRPWSISPAWRRPLRYVVFGSGSAVTPQQTGRDLCSFCLQRQQSLDGAFVEEAVLDRLKDDVPEVVSAALAALQVSEVTSCSAWAPCRITQPANTNLTIKQTNWTENISSLCVCQRSSWVTREKIKPAPFYSENVNAQNYIIQLRDD